MTSPPNAPIGAFRILFIIADAEYWLPLLDSKAQMMNRARAGHRARLKMLLVGHACSPELGSEPGLTWNWAWYLSESHEVWVLAHPQYRAAVDPVTARHGDRGPRVVWVEVPKRYDPWNPDRGERGIHFHYVLWQHAALVEARRLHATLNFDLVHHVGWGTVNAPSGLWRLGVPFVWGPLGGGQAAPLNFARHLGRRGVLTETARTVRSRLIPLLPSLRRTVKNSSLILATNRETADVLHRAGARHVELFLDNGIQRNQIMSRHRARRAEDRLELLWAGRVESRKALPLALEAMARSRDLPVRLTVAGDGPMRRSCERKAVAMVLSESVRFLGMVPRARMASLFARSDALLFTSLQDAFGSVVIEAMAAGLPVIGLDHQGVGALIPTHAAIKVPVSSPEATARALAAAIRTLANSPESGCRVGEAARRHAMSETWSLRITRMNELYRQYLELSDGSSWFPKNNRDGPLLSKAPT